MLNLFVENRLVHAAQCVWSINHCCLDNMCGSSFIVLLPLPIPVRLFLQLIYRSAPQNSNEKIVQGGKTRTTGF